MTPTRRQFGATVLTVGVAGCLTGEPGTGFDEGDTTEASTADDTEDEPDETTQQVVEDLDERGLAVQSTTTTEHAIRLTVQTTSEATRISRSPPVRLRRCATASQPVTATCGYVSRIAASAKGGSGSRPRGRGGSSTMSSVTASIVR